MSVQPVNYEAVIQDLETKRQLMNARFDAAIAAIRQVLALEGQPTLPGLPATGTRPTPIGESRPYRGMKMVEAAKAHLKQAGPVPNPKLARSLEYGGFQHKSKSFANTLNSVLRRRAEQVGDVKKSGGAWVLVEAN